jgi:YfiH family protein
MDVILANWAAPQNIKALTTKRTGGFSKPPFNGLNLAQHVDDDFNKVKQNRELLKSHLNLPCEPNWLEQTHSTDCIIASKQYSNQRADAQVTAKKGLVLAVLTADCLPILLCNHTGTEIAAIHAGWRGLCGGIIENTLSKMNSTPNTIHAWIGPAICQQHFETGTEVKQAFAHIENDDESLFLEKNTKWYISLQRIAESVLNKSGVLSVSQSNQCTFGQNNEYYSYRRQQQTGRIASLIWIT